MVRITDKWQRNAEIGKALQVIIRESGVDLGQFAADYNDRFTRNPDPDCRSRSSRVMGDLVRALMARTGCKASTARGHVAEWARKLR